MEAKKVLEREILLDTLGYIPFILLGFVIGIVATGMAKGMFPRFGLLLMLLLATAIGISTVLTGRNVGFSLGSMVGVLVGLGFFSRAK